VIIGNKFYQFNNDGSQLVETQEDIKGIIEQDKNVLQNYGRPNNKGGKPYGIYYKFEKKVEKNNVGIW